MEIHKCSQCDFVSSWISNTRRHFNKKHDKNDIIIHKNAIIDNKNAIINNKKDIIDNQNAIIDAENTVLHKNILFECSKCNKCLSSKQYLEKHIIICKGIKNKLECQICNNIYSSSSNLSRHRKTCKEKDKQLIESETNNITSLAQQNNSNIENQTNNIIGNQTNNTNYIIVFASETGAIEFVKTPEFNEKLKAFLEGNNHIDNIKNFNKELLSIKDNQCVKKTNIKSKISKVHIGNNKWQTKNDEDVYPQMACNLADDMCNAIMQMKTRDRYKTLERILDCMSDNGYVADTKEAQKEMVDNFKNVVKDLKLIVYDLTKEQ